ncbi:MAG TPA: FliG C-terminal domain-containing protein, partial [Spirochaetota bacterium]|nr:FliG C-terminal domain-containing protein [Spirochaetota bacterium]
VDGIEFEKICEMLDRHIQKVLREVDTQDLAIALKGTSAELQGAIFRNMSPRASSLLREDMDFMGPVRREDVESRQEKILNIVIKLAECGDIIIPNGSEFIE